MNFPPFASAVGVILLLLFSGSHLLRLFPVKHEGLPDYLSWSWLLGVSYFALGVSLMSWMGLCTLGPLLGLCLLPPALSYFQKTAPRGPRPLHFWSFLPALLAVGLSVLICQADSVKEVDAQMRWVQHGQWMAETGSLVPERMEDPSWAKLHPSYPPLLSSVIGFALQLPGANREGTPLLFGPFFFLALLGILHGFCIRNTSSKWTFIWVAGFAFTPCFAWLARDGLTVGMAADSALADIPLALFLTALAALSIRILEGEDSPPHRGLLLLVGAGSMLVKQEGAAFVLASLPLSTLFVVWLSQKNGQNSISWRPFGWLFSGAIAAWILWAGVSTNMPVAEGENYLSVEGFQNLWTGFDRLPQIGLRVLEEFFSVNRWGGLWFVAVAATAVGLYRKNTSALFLTLLLLLGIGVSVAGFMSSGWNGGDIKGLMDSSLTRLLMHHAPLVLLLGVKSLHSAKEKRQPL
ncbi:MAG: hypothetical protein CMJ96_06265 [Planctomycetes bacterium]|nr:hypothetical protein [Planctomycetota bacterium]